MLMPVHQILPESRNAESAQSIDAGGAVAVTIALVLLIFAITSVPPHGWLSPATWVPGILGIAALILFIMIERRHPAPLVPLAVTTRTAVLAPNGAIGLQSMVGIAWLYLLTFFFQDLHAMNPMISGLWFAPMTAASIAGAIIAGRVVPRIGTPVNVDIVILAVYYPVLKDIIDQYADELADKSSSTSPIQSAMTPMRNRCSSRLSRLVVWKPLMQVR
jgi:hypothetical protein